MLRPDPGGAGPPGCMLHSPAFAARRRASIGNALTMKDRIPSLTAVALLILLVAGTWWASDYTLRSIQVDPPRRVTHERDSWSDSFVMVLTDPKGVTSDRLEGSSMNHFPDTDSYEITDARAVSQKPDTPITIGTSDHAVLDENGTRIVMTGNAKLHRVAGADSNALD